MKRRVFHLCAMGFVLLAVSAASASGPAECKNICQTQEYECQYGGGGWQQDCDDLDAYYDFVNDECNLDAFCIYS